MSLQSAVEFATRAHFGSWREGDFPLPYVTHPVEVLLNLRYVGLVTDTEMLCAAVLHDTVEGESATFEQIEKQFGPRVCSLVKELTRSEPTGIEVADLTKEEIWKLRSRMLLDEIAKMSSDAKQIKLADRLSNVQDARRTKSARKLRRYLDQTEKILAIVPRETNRALWNAIEAEIH